MQTTISIQRSSLAFGLIAATILVSRSAVASPSDEYSTSSPSDVKPYVYTQAPTPVVDGAQTGTPIDGKPDAAKEAEAAKKKAAAEKKNVNRN